MSSNVTKRQLHDFFDTADEALHACIRDGDLQQLQQLLNVSPAPDVDVDVDYSHPGYGPPIHFAAWCGNLDAVELLLAAGADPLLISHDELRLTAIGFAALKGHRHVVNRLWTVCAPEGHVHGIKPALTCLVLAATYGHVAMVEDLLNKWDFWPQELKTDALLWASRRWHFAVVTLLLSRATFTQSTIQEALHVATASKIMLSTEIKVKYEGIDYVNQQELIALLIDEGAGPNACPNNMPLIYTVAYNAALTGALKTLLEKGADPNKTNKTGKSALHVLASPVGSDDNLIPNTVLNETAIRLLLQHGAAVSQPDHEGECPLHWAAFGLNLRLFRLYLSSCLDQERDSLLQFTSPHGENLLHFAAAGGCIEIMEFLLAQGFDINAKNSNGWTPLICTLTPIKRYSYGSVRSPPDVVRAARFLLSHGADPNITTDEAWTPLHALALHCDPDTNGQAADLAHDLIACGVDPEARARLISPAAEAAAPSLGLPWGYRLRGVLANPLTERDACKIIIRPVLTPLYWAAERGALGVIRTLLAHGVDVSSVDVDGISISPTRMAAESNFLKRQPGLVDSTIELLLAAGAGF